MASALQQHKFDHILASLLVRTRVFAASRIEAAWAEDIAQEVMLLLLQKRSDYEDLPEAEMEARMTGAAIQTATYKVMALVRRKSFQNETRRGESLDNVALPAAELNAEQAFAQRQLQKMMLACIEAAAPGCRAMMRARLDDISVVELWEKMGRPGAKNAFEVKDHRCRAKLRECMMRKITAEGKRNA